MPTDFNKTELSSQDLLTVAKNEFKNFSIFKFLQKAGSLVQQFHFLILLPYVQFN